MYQAFMVVLREGVEAFLIVAIVFTYLRKTAQTGFLSAVGWGIAASAVLSGILGYLLWITEGANQPLWEGILASTTVVLVISLVVHMWKVGPALKQSMENRLSKVTTNSGVQASYWGLFLFTVVMISREGMEMILLLFQIHEPRIVSGVLLGVAAAAGVSVLWQQFGYLINLKHFFQVTALYLLLFTVQIAVQAFHEFTEAGIFPNSEFLHKASEPFSTEGIYGKWYANITFAVCGLWLVADLIYEKLSLHRKSAAQKCALAIKP